MCCKYLMAWLVDAVLLHAFASIVCRSQNLPSGLVPISSHFAPRNTANHEHDAATTFKTALSMEVDSYQGLVGRPGIDFPVLTQIPRTVFDCKSHGNGYFADLDTRCQVFHICDEGKKISFLCPNGTIFRQLDLICDWWFKVDCSATPNHLAESTEMLTQAKRARLQSKHPVLQPINPNDKRLTTSIQDKRLLLANNNHLHHQEFFSSIRTMSESNRGVHPEEIIKFKSHPSGSEIIGNKNGNDKKLSFTDDEIQDTAQSASFASVSKKMFDTYYTQQHLSKQVINTDKSRRAETSEENADRDHSSSLQPLRKSHAKSNDSIHKKAMSYMPYTTARKLNLSGKVTQFYTPTVPTFTARARTSTVGVVPFDTVLTTKATTIKIGTDSNDGGTLESQSFVSSFNLPIRREGTADEESVMGHAIEIMQTIQNLKIDENQNHDISARGDTAGLVNSVPDKFYDNNMPLLEFLLHPSENSTNADRYRRMRLAPERKSNFPEGYKSLLTQTTLNEYDRLFYSRSGENDENRIDHKYNITERNKEDINLEHDLEGQSSRYPIPGVTNSSQIRELAQIFTHALSAYLQDPITFRRILTEIRPKAPGANGIAKTALPETTWRVVVTTSVSPSVETTTYVPVDGATYYASSRGLENLEVLDFSDARTTTSNIPTATDTSVVTTSTPSTTTNIKQYENHNTDGKNNTGIKQGKSLSIHFITNNRNKLADEVNDELSISASSKYNTGYTEHTGFEIKEDPQTITVANTPSSNVQLHQSIPMLSESQSTSVMITTEPQNILKPPVLPFHQYPMAQKPKTQLLLKDDEQLQQTQSDPVLTKENPQPIFERSKYSVISLHNFGKNNNNRETYSTTVQTPSTTNAPSTLVKQIENKDHSSRTTMSYTVFFDPLTINDELMDLEKPKPTVSNAPLIHQLEHYGWNETHLNAKLISPTTAADNLSTKISEDHSRNDVIGIQKKASEMFGSLDDAQADKLMIAMKMADKNKSMRRLILLLIRTCDDDPANANEESRKALLEALINIGGIADAHKVDELQSFPVEATQGSDLSHRRGKEIDAAHAGNVVYNVPISASHLINITATTENYADMVKLMKESNEEIYSDEKAGKDEVFGSAEWSGGSDLQTTVATTKVYYSSSEGAAKYLPKNVNSRDEWAYGYNEEQPTQSTTTLHPTTFFQTTTDSSSTVFTTTESTIPTTIPTTLATTDGPDYFGATSVSTTYTDSEKDQRSVESFESEHQPVMLSQRFPKDLTNALGYSSTKGEKYNSPHNSDTRALELLKSLYSLAARWG